MTTKRVAVTEDQLLLELARIAGRCTLPDRRLVDRSARRPRLARLPRGDADLGRRHRRARHVCWSSSSSTSRAEGASVERPLGRTIMRFNTFERAAHWMTAACFIVLAITGLNLTFGAPLLPILARRPFRLSAGASTRTTTWPSPSRSASF